MPPLEATAAHPADRLPIAAAADLQDDLLVVTNDLDRLQRLLADACDALMLHFQRAVGVLRRPADAAPPDPGRVAAADHLGQAVTAMQFQDMASQLIAHTTLRLRSCADRLAADAFGADGEGTQVCAAPARPNPVTQDEMDAGSIELF